MWEQLQSRCNTFHIQTQISQSLCQISVTDMSLEVYKKMSLCSQKHMTLFRQLIFLFDQHVSSKISCATAISTQGREINICFFLKNKCDWTFSCSHQCITSVSFICFINSSYHCCVIFTKDIKWLFFMTSDIIL